MTPEATTRDRRPSGLPAAGELAAGLDRVRDLVTLRRLFVVYGAPAEDLRLCDAEIDRQRRSIARFARAGAEALRAA